MREVTLDRERLRTNSAIAAWRRRGYAVRWIAERYGITEEAVQRALARESLLMKPETSWKHKSV